jgi:hypothetical protein
MVFAQQDGGVRYNTENGGQNATGCAKVPACPEDRDDCQCRGPAAYHVVIDRKAKHVQGIDENDNEIGDSFVRWVGKFVHNLVLRVFEHVFGNQSLVQGIILVGLLETKHYKSAILDLPS